MGRDIPVLTGCPVASGLMTIAIIRMMPKAASTYIISFLSMTLSKNIPFLVINNGGIGSRMPVTLHYFGKVMTVTPSLP